ncbi:ABC transporter permease [Halorubrum lipolyticum]|uniref:Binding-protein-dependent transport systems inner membrane component n=1 Tax=Halorubrum lipolyticum DSM 21995 TaxID=1227482 RepID=M0NT92_9EURY|nr:ABC transporter permease [Halorubrum lipolyticum]EMA59845.1 binding-protein-dependent transport systems inner membrane component [Halorubrum lipolyticum DSM 21995]
MNGRVQGSGSPVRAADVALPLGGLLAATGAWWALVAALNVPSYLLPPPDAVAAVIVGNPGLFVRNAVATAEKVALGGSVGIAGGFVLAVAIARLPWLRRAVYPYLVTVRVLPKIAVAPLLLIYLGTGTATAVVFIGVIAFFPMVLSTAAGLDRTPTEHRDLLRSVDAGALDTFLRLELPYAVPDLFAGLKQSVTLAVIGAVVAEWLVADSGLGFLILLGSENVQVDLMLAALTVLVALGLSLYGLLVLVQHRFIWTQTGG